jgi:two-component system alkaline phosphatase synthesis response regulator PhoP
MQFSVLLIEDDKEISDGITIYLRHKNITVIQAFNGEDALYLFEKENPEIIIIDNMLPDTNGTALCKQIRYHSSVGVVFLTALSAKHNVVNAFNCGADYYMTKPFDMDILFTRIVALHNRLCLGQNSENLPHQLLKTLHFDKIRNDVFFQKSYANLTITEYKILRMLASSSEYVSDEAVLSILYNHPNDIMTRTLSVHVTNIRKKLHSINRSDLKIQRKHKKGYRLTNEI